jgi:hypothetical protein
MTELADVTGYWNFNANGSTGKLTIFSNNQGNLEVQVTFDGLGRVDSWEGSWDDGAGRITLIRHLPGNTIQQHIGFLGNNNPANIILAGYFTESDISSNAPRTQFGWFAQSRLPIIP